MAQAEIDFLPDVMVGLSEMHEYGYSWNEMLPLTKDRASELFGEDVSVYSFMRTVQKHLWRIRKHYRRMTVCSA